MVFNFYHSDKLVNKTAMKPCMLKLSSVAEHNANPPIIGIRERFTYIPVFSPVFDKNRI